MNINNIKSFFNKNSMQMVKSTQGYDCIQKRGAKVFMPAQLEDSVYNAASKVLPKMEKYSELSGLPITFAPKGKATLMNYGARTIYIKNDAPEKEIIGQIEKHINEVL